jgi:hypothetical protein
MSAFSSNIQRGTRAAQPSAASMVVGALYCVTDESGIIERSTGAAWQSFSPSAAPSPAWVLRSSAAASGANVDFIGLAGNTEIMVFIKQVTATGACIRQVLVSIDNGASYLNASGDYINVDSNGAETNGTVLSLTNGNNATAQSAWITIKCFNLTTPKPVEAGQPAVNLVSYIPTANALNAVQVRPHANSFNGGTIYIYGR